MVKTRNRDTNDSATPLNPRVPVPALASAPAPAPALPQLSYPPHHKVRWVQASKAQKGPRKIPKYPQDIHTLNIC